MISRLAIAFALVLAVGASLSVHAQEKTPPVPSEFADLYHALDRQLDQFASRLKEPEKPGGAPVTFSAEVMTANANRGDTLLQPQTFVGIRLELDRIKELGLKGATVAVSFPLLYRPYHAFRQKPEAYDQYLAFYRKLAAEVRSRGLKLIVECGPIFPSGAYSDPSLRGMDGFYMSLTPEKFRAANAEHVRAVAAEMKPDYLSLGSEPDTEAELTHQPLASPEQFADFIRYTVDRLKDVRAPNLNLGAGVGTWQQGYRQYLDALLKTDVDYIDFHVYPVNHDWLLRSLEIADLVLAAGKKPAISEAWLLKSSDEEIGRIQAASDSATFSRDVYSFWEPLDSKFLQLMVKFARMKQLAFFSPFWTKYLYAYLDYDPATARMSAPERIAAHQKSTVPNIVSGGYSGSGRAYQAAVASKP